MGLLSALGRQGMKSLRSGQMFGRPQAASAFDFAGMAGMTEQQALMLVQKARSGARLTQEENAAMRQLIAYARSTEDLPQPESALRTLLSGQ